jgi:hypothetical protein
MNHDEESIEGLEELPVQVILNRIASVCKMGRKCRCKQLDGSGARKRSNKDN